MSKYFETVPIDQKPDKEAFKKGECRVYCMAKYGKIEEVLWYEEEKFPFPNLYTHWLREIEHLPLTTEQADPSVLLEALEEIVFLDCGTPQTWKDIAMKKAAKALTTYKEPNTEK
jgi:hypothetical protein